MRYVADCEAAGAHNMYNGDQRWGLLKYSNLCDHSKIVRKAEQFQEAALGKEGACTQARWQLVQAYGKHVARRM
jgi:hypothetical protein